MTIPQNQHRANDPRHFGPIKKPGLPPPSRSAHGVPPEFAGGGMQIGAVFSPIAVVPFGFAAIQQGTTPTATISEASAAGRAAYRCLASVSTDDVGGAFTWQGFSLHLKSCSATGSGGEFADNRANDRTPAAWGDGLGEQAAIIMAPARLLPDELASAAVGSWSLADSLAPWLTYEPTTGGELVMASRPRTVIAVAFPIGNYDTPTSTRELVLSERENPLSERIVEGESVKVFLAVKPSDGLVNDTPGYLHGFCNGRLILSTQKASATVS